jgi:ABC-type branched-subunit amino acid transport system ATPase component
MRVVTALSDRVVVLDQGRVLADGNAAEVMQRREVITAYLGVQHA